MEVWPYAFLTTVGPSLCCRAPHVARVSFLFMTSTSLSEYTSQLSATRTISTVLPSLARILTLLCPYLLPSTVGSWYDVAELSAGQRIDRPCKATQVASGLCAGVKVQKVKMLL